MPCRYFNLNYSALSSDEEEEPAAKKQKTLSEQSVNSGEPSPSTANDPRKEATAPKEGPSAAAAPTLSKVLGKRKKTNASAADAPSGNPEHVSNVVHVFFSMNCIVFYQSSPRALVRLLAAEHWLEVAFGCHY